MLITTLNITLKNANRFFSFAKSSLLYNRFIITENNEFIIDENNNFLIY